MRDAGMAIDATTDDRSQLAMRVVVLRNRPSFQTDWHRTKAISFDLAKFDNEAERPKDNEPRLAGGNGPAYDQRAEHHPMSDPSVHASPLIFFGFINPILGVRRQERESCPIVDRRVQ